MDPNTDEVAEAVRNYCELKDLILAEFQTSTKKTVDMERELLLLKVEVETVKKEVDRLSAQLKLLREENDFLIHLNSESQQRTLQDAARSTEISQLQIKLQATESAHYEAKVALAQAKIQYEGEVKRVQTEIEIQTTKYAHELMLLNLSQQGKQQGLMLKIQDLEDNIAALNAEIVYQQQEKSKAISELTTKWQDEQQRAAAKQLEIQQLHREMANREVLHSEAMQNAKMKYEEHLLQITLQMNRDGQDSTAQMYKKRLMQQKIEHDKEIQDLKIKISNLETVKKRKSKQ